MRSKCALRRLPDKRWLRLSFESYARNFILFYITPRPDTILNERNEVCNLVFHLIAGRGIGISHRLKLRVQKRRQNLPNVRQKKPQDLRQETRYEGDCPYIRNLWRLIGRQGAIFSHGSYNSYTSTLIYFATTIYLCFLIMCSYITLFQI